MAASVSALESTSRPSPLASSVGRPLDLLAVIGILLRRFYVTVPLLLVTAALAVYAIEAEGPRYRASQEVLLLLPNTPSRAGSRTNPYLGIGPLSATSEVLARVLNEGPVRADLVRDGALHSYSVRNTAGGADPPILVVSAEGAVGADAVRTVHQVTAALQQELERRQLAAGSPARSLITAEVLIPEDTPEQVLGSEARVVGAIALLGAGATVLAGLLVETLAIRRRAKSAGPPPPPLAVAEPERPPPAAADGLRPRLSPKGVRPWSRPTRSHR
jgi:hypothetical protein